MILCPMFFFRYTEIERDSKLKAQVACSIAKKVEEDDVFFLLASTVAVFLLSIPKF